MKKFLKRLFLISFAFFMISHFTTKYINHTHLYHGLMRAFASLPLEFWEGRGDIKMQIYAASQEEVVELLKAIPKDPKILPINILPTLHGVGKPPAYVFLRLKNSSTWSYGDIKCYCSGFPYPLVTFILLSSHTPYYHDIIFPYPTPIDGQEEKNYTIKTRWKSFWGR